MNTDQKRTLKRHGRKRRTLGWTLLTLGLLVAAGRAVRERSA